MYKLLKYLSPEELLKFEKFITSPYFNNRPKLIKLFDILKVSDENNPDKKEMFSSLYPGEKYNDARIRKLISDFYKLFEKFLGYLGTEKLDLYALNTNMLEMMQDKGMVQEFEVNYRQISKSLTSKYFKEDDYYKSFSRIELLNYYSGHNKIKIISASGLQKASFYMDMQFVYTKLHLLRDILMHKLSHKDGYVNKIEFYDNVLNFAKNNIEIISKEHPNLFIIYLSVMAIIEEGNSDHIKELELYIRKNERKFDKNRLSYYYMYLTSHYWIKVNKGEIAYFKKLIDLYKYMDQKKILLSERYLPHHIFNSIVIAAISGNDFAWLEKFIEKYKNDIEPEYLNDVYNLSLAKLNFSKGNYSLTLKNLNNIEFKDPNYFINAKAMLLKTLYEQGDLDGVKYSLDSLKHYVYRNNKLVAQQVHNIKMLVKYFKHLIKLKNKDKLALHKFLEDLDREKTFVPQRNWLIEKISELMTRFNRVT